MKVTGHNDWHDTTFSRQGDYNTQWHLILLTYPVKAYVNTQLYPVIYSMTCHNTNTVSSDTSYHATIDSSYYRYNEVSQFVCSDISTIYPTTYFIMYPVSHNTLYPMTARTIDLTERHLLHTVTCHMSNQVTSRTAYHPVTFHAI